MLNIKPQFLNSEHYVTSLSRDNCKISANFLKFLTIWSRDSSDNNLKWPCRILQVLCRIVSRLRSPDCQNHNPTLTQPLVNLNCNWWLFTAPIQELNTRSGAMPRQCWAHVSGIYERDRGDSVISESCPWWQWFYYHNVSVFKVMDSLLCYAWPE